MESGNSVVGKYTRGINLIKNQKGQYFVFNAHGDVVQLTDASGNVVKNYHYDAFGIEENIDKEDSNPFRYCAEYYDKETGTIYLRARYYNASIGRFISQDPIRDGLNWYTYCGNNPTAFRDPSGMLMEGDAKELGMGSAVYNSLKHLGDLWSGTTNKDAQKAYAAAANRIRERAIADKQDNPSILWPGTSVDKTQGIYVTNLDAIQKIGGYNDYYDVIFDVAADMRTIQFRFTHEDVLYRIQFWRGNYPRWGVGAEMGIYEYFGKIPITKNGNTTFVDQYKVTSNNLEMSFILMSGDNVVLSNYGTHWLLTGFDPYNYDKFLLEDLYMYGSINFNDSGMSDEFVEAASGAKNFEVLDVTGSTVYYKWY